MTGRQSSRQSAAIKRVGAVRGDLFEGEGCQRADDQHGASRPGRARRGQLALGIAQPVERLPRTRFLPWALVSVLLLTSVAFGYRAYRGDSGKEPDRDPLKDSLNGATGVASSGDVVLQAKGYVVPISLVQVSAKVGGQLVKIHPEFKEGNKFKEGQILAWIEKIDYEAERDQARATAQASPLSKPPWGASARSLAGSTTIHSRATRSWRSTRRFT